MAPTKVLPPTSFRNQSRKDPERHRHAYEQAGQVWPENIGKHLRRAAALEAAEGREAA